MQGLQLLRDIVAPQPPANPADRLVDLAKTLTAVAPRQAHDAPEVAKRRTPDIEEVPLAELQVDHAGGAQRPPDRDKVLEFVTHLKAGGKLPPIKVNERPDGSRWITDGQHRALAALAVGRKTIPAEVTYKPSQEEAAQTNIVTKIAEDVDDAATDLLMGAGARRVGKRLVLSLGQAGEVAYLPHGSEWVAKQERGSLTVDGRDARMVLHRLGLADLATEIRATKAEWPPEAA